MHLKHLDELSQLRKTEFSTTPV